ncbi:MAG: hypothetical protein GF384_06000 [Elusimicrobia bacterium]|nr:hypothetical protein [Elusimicrobiota bacterium]MBD3412301.1 hypothetical protein [Elusimicrobiota bacterium]
MDVLKMMKQAMHMKSSMKQVQVKLAQKTVTVDKNGICVTFSGDLKKADVAITPDAHKQGAAAVSSIVSSNVKEALHEAKKESAEEFKKAFGGIDLDGLSDLL